MVLKTGVLILVACFLLALPGKTQTISRSTLGMAGSSQTMQTKDHSYYVSQSIGQAGVIGTFTNNGRVLRQGFQQPPEKLQIKKIEIDQLKAVIYPNPTDQLLHIRLIDQSLTKINIQLMDNVGRLLYQVLYDEVRPITLDLASYSSGVYFLNIVGNGKYLYTSVIKK